MIAVKPTLSPHVDEAYDTCTEVCLWYLVCAAAVPGKPVRVERLLANLGYGKR
jgi:hypothetical protein